MLTQFTHNPEVDHVLNIEANLQKHDESKPMSREEVKATLIKVRKMLPRLNNLMTSSVPF